MTELKDIALNQIKAKFLNLSLYNPKEESLIVANFGNFTDVKINSLLKITEDSVLELGCKRQIMRRICSLLVETLQNSYNHSAKDKDGKAQSFFTLSEGEDYFILSTGNLISAEDIIPLEQKLSNINKLNHNELRKLYIETLCNDNFNQKGGAGLGFLTMAKKIQQKLNYSFIDVNKKLAYFTLSLKVSKN